MSNSFAGHLYGLAFGLSVATVWDNLGLLWVAVSLVLVCAAYRVDVDARGSRP